MIHNNRVLAVIPARGGSKGIKKKNIIDFQGKPLIYYTINAAKKSRYIDEVIVSTDSEEIKDISIRAGARVPFIRPQELASDTAKTSSVVWHVIEKLKQIEEFYDILVLLQPTSPLRTVEDIDCALEKFEESGERGIVSISEVQESPLLIRSVIDGQMKSLLNVSSTVRRQDMPRYYKVNGSIYINRLDEIKESFSFNDNPEFFIMKNSHSVDIDEYVDVAIANYYYSRLD